MAQAMLAPQDTKGGYAKLLMSKWLVDGVIDVFINLSRFLHCVTSVLLYSLLYSRVQTRKLLGLAEPIYERSIYSIAVDLWRLYVLLT